ncbi:fungal-specific transcription factor domain-domain-containing protein, partial [Naematelia encephala]
YAPYPPSSSPHTFAQPSLPTPQSRPANSRKPSIPPPPEDQTQYKVARAISSCTRCRSRKQKCDGKLPACSACERAKVECIGFDAISKTNVSRNYLHSLEQEVASLRAQVAALTSPGAVDSVGLNKRSIAASAVQAVSSFARPSDLIIDPALQNEGLDPSLRSPWDSPSATSAGHQRRLSEVPFPPTTLGSDSPKSPYALQHRLGQHPGVHATSLTRMVHDAALRQGHAANTASTLNPPAPNSASGSASDKGSHDSPAGEANGTSPTDVLTPRSGLGSARRPPTASPLTGSTSLGGGGSKAKRRAFAVPPLPPQAAVERLVAAYVDFVGVTAPIIHIPSLGKQLIRIREGTDVEQSDIFVVMMVLALSTMASSRFVDPPDELRACSEAFHAEAMKHLDAVFEEQSYVGLQAILLLVWYSLLNPDKGSIWFLVGLAVRTCVDLGFHNENNSQVEQLDALEVDMRRRLFWCTYKMDRLLSQSLGRPPSIPDGFINVALPSYLHDVDIHPGHYGPLSGEACSYKAVFLHTTKLRQLQSEILTRTYGVHGIHGSSPGPTPEWFDDCFGRLQAWLASTPEPRGTVSNEGYAISFHNSALLLFRPSPGCPRPERKALATVLASSSYIIRIYRRMQLNNRISWLWMTSHFSFMAGLSFLYAFFNLYRAGAEGVPTLEEAMMDTDACLAVLDYLAPRVPSASACHDTLQSVSKAIIEQLTSESRPSSAPASPRSQLLRGAPISSSRDDPLPSETFPTPLPPVILPYELTLLDNLFVNPMAQHNKASDYTSNKKCGPKMANDVRESYNTSANSHYPSSAFTNGSTAASLFASGQGDSHNGHGGLGPYGMAAQVSTPSSSGAAFNGNGNGQVSVGAALTAGAGGIGAAGGAGGQQQEGGTDGAFDIFSFLMDEEGGLGGTGSWDALEVPADFSLW